MKLNQKTVEVCSIKRVTKDLIVIDLEKPNTEFFPGQYFSIGLPDMGINREYSVLSSPRDGFLSFYLRVVDGGTLTTKFLDEKKPEFVSINGPFGQFCSSINQRNDSCIFICSGTGIAPFNSVINAYQNLSYRIIHGIRHLNEIPNFAEQYGERYHPCISQAEQPHLASRVTNHVQDANFNEADKFYICGNSRMIVDVVKILEFKGINSSRIETEAFF